MVAWSGENCPPRILELSTELPFRSSYFWSIYWSAMSYREITLAPPNPCNVDVHSEGKCCPKAYGCWALRSLLMLLFLSRKPCACSCSQCPIFSNASPASSVFSASSVYSYSAAMASILGSDTEWLLVCFSGAAICCWLSNAVMRSFPSPWVFFLAYTLLL